MVLSDDQPRDKVVTYLKGLKEDVAKLQTEAARINKYQALFKVCVCVCVCGWVCMVARAALF